jgi:hypothetical protein
VVFIVFFVTVSPVALFLNQHQTEADVDDGYRPGPVCVCWFFFVIDGSYALKRYDDARTPVSYWWLENIRVTTHR